MNGDRQSRACIYCGEGVRKVRKGEHILAEAIGGRLTVSEVCRGRTVCNPCNNGVLSELDTEMCSRSPLSIIAAQELDGFVSQTWEIDHCDNNLLLEAKPNFKGGSMTAYPQMIFHADGPQIRGDGDQFQEFGGDRFWHVFVEKMLEAFRAYQGGEKRRLHLHRVETNSVLLTRYRFPPRIFARRPIQEFKGRVSFELRYLHAKDKRFALSQIANWKSDTRFGRFETYLGSELPVVRCRYEVTTTLRALLKLAINLLAAFCPNTPVNRRTFGRVIAVIMGQSPVHPKLTLGNGFVHAEDIEPTVAADSGHSFRLQYSGGHWHVYSSFFGGRLGAFVKFPGPNLENWCRADIVAPLNSKLWTITTGRVLLRPRRPRIEFTDPRKFMPSVEMMNVVTEEHLVLT